MLLGLGRLRPMNVTELLDTTFALYRANFVLFAGIVAVLAIPETLIKMVVTATTPSLSTLSQPSSNGQANFDWNQVAGPLAGTVAGNGVTAILGWIFGTMITGALAYAISRRYLARPITILSSYTDLGPRIFLRLLLAPVLIGLIFFLAFLTGAGIAFGVAYLIAQSVLWAGILAGVALGLALVGTFVYAAISITFMSQAIVLEGTSMIEGALRSWQLVRNSWWRVFGIVLLVGIMVAIMQSIVGGLASVALSFGHPVIATGIGGIVSILLQPIALGASTLLYYDLRIRKEGFDLEYATQAAGGLQPA